ncbi:MAG: hypothetical protein MUP24_03815, partial [Gillisia sp.]|nr:hypothetical protein [Gillisia sp.]
MKNIFQNLLFISLLLAFGFTNAQSDQDLLVEDMLLIADNFAAPAAEAAAIQSSAGWFSSARDLGKWKVDISLHGNALFVPGSKQTKLASNTDFNILNIQGSSNALLPTVFGGDTDAVFEGELLGEDFTFDAIDGLNKKVV